jgi:hypothetical protein
MRGRSVRPLMPEPGMTRSRGATASQTLADLGITYDQSSKWQRMAKAAGASEPQGGGGSEAHPRSPISVPWSLRERGPRATVHVLPIIFRSSALKSSRSSGVSAPGSQVGTG